MTDLSGRTALVTGGARGIGAACVRALARAGARVVVADVLEAEGLALADELPGRAAFARLDVTSAEDWQDAVRVARGAGGSLDVLVNNAGIIRPGGVEQQTADDFRRVVEVNLTGTFLGMQAVLPQMRRQQRGSVVNIASTAGLIAYAGLAGYTASKWAVTGLTEAAALDMSGTGVRINSVHPGPTRTSMLDGLGDEAAAHQPIPRLGEPEEVAEAVLYLSGASSAYVTGTHLVVDGGAVLVRG